MKRSRHRLEDSARHRGFTLVELIMVLAVAAILTSAGVPAFASLINSSKVSTASSDLLVTLNLARSEAIRSGGETILCKSIDGTSCANNSTAWSKGWLLFRNNNSNQTRDTGETIIRTQSEYESSLNFTFRTANYLRFDSRGRINVNGRFCFENSYDASNSRAVVVTQAGHLRIEKRNSNNNCGT